MVTIKDVAKEANVSTATVSMVINKKPGISSSTTARVERVIKKLNYIGNANAKSLVTNRSMTLGLVVGSLRNSYFNEIIEAVEVTARRHGYSVFICDAAGSLDLAIESFKALQGRGVDGILISISLEASPAYLEAIANLVANGISVVSLTRMIPEEVVPVVSFLDTENIYELVQRLVSLEHRRIAAIGAPEGSWLNNYRLESYQRVMREWGIYDEDLITYTGLTIEEGRHAARRLLQENPDITAIFCTTDVAAIGAIQAAGELGIKVPEELSVTGCDGIPVGELITPRLTTVATPRTEIGRVATEMIVRLIEDDSVESRITLFPCSVSEGASIALARRM